MNKRTAFYIAGLAGVMLIAAGLRLWKLNSVPRGLSHDEANIGLMATTVLQGNHPVFFEIYTGEEPGQIYPLAAAFWLLGPGRLTERLLSVAFGLVTVLLTYLLATRLFESRLVGLLSSLFVAVSFWQVFVSRLGLRAVVMPPIQILMLLFFWRAMQMRRLRDFALAGIFGGLSLYTYLSSRFLPFVPLVFVLYLIVRREKLRGAWAGLALMAALWIAVFMPLGIYYINNPYWFFLRADQASLLSQPGGSAVLQRIWASTLATLGMFTFKGDPSWRYNLAARPVYDWIAGLAFYAGVAISLVKSIKGPKLNPHALILITQIIMLVPGFITDGAPHFLRVMGTVPTTFIFPAIAIQELVLRVRPHRRWLVAAGLAGWLVFAVYSTYHDYFQVWAHNPEAREIYNASLAEIADYLRESPPDGTVYLASSSPELDRVAFDLSANNDPPPVRWFNTTQALLLPDSAAQPAQYFVPAPVPMPAALRALLPAGDPLRILAPDGNLSFEIIPAARPTAPEQPIEAVLGNQVRVLGYDAPSPALVAGQTFDMQLHWRVEANPDPRRRWAWFVHLVDRRGYQWANWSGQGFEVADWLAGDYVIQQVPLDIPFDAPDIDYHLEIGVFDQNNGERLLDTGGSDHVVVDDIRVRLADPASEAGILERHQEGRLGDRLIFVGSTQGAEQLAPGQEMTLILAWAAEKSLPGDFPFRLQLTAQDGSVVYETSWSPLGGEYPTSLWPAGNIIRDVVFLTVPAGIPPGEYALVLSADGLEGTVTAGSVRVEP